MVRPEEEAEDAVDLERNEDTVTTVNKMPQEEAENSARQSAASLVKETRHAPETPVKRPLSDVITVNDAARNVAPPSPEVILKCRNSRKKRSSGVFGSIWNFFSAIMTKLSRESKTTLRRCKEISR